MQFFLQLAVILLACRAVGQLVSRVGQPKVVGEMIAGILLGPSLLGLIAPSLQAALFPASSFGILAAVSQVGLVLYMFIVGTHLQTDFLRHAFRGAMLISVAGVAVPFVLGAGFAVFLYEDGRFFAPAVSGWQSMVYLGAAMSITAFPVLARIIQERGMTCTALGSLALTAGASNDAIAWCLLAVVLAGSGETISPALWSISGAAVYAGVILVAVRSRLAGMASAVERRGSLSPGHLTLILSLVMAGAWFTEMIGVHAVFGAFICGLAMPRGLVTQELSRQIEPLATAMLVPLFFAYSGLSTHASLLWSSDVLMLSLVAILVASIGKGVACWGAARLAGRPNREAMAMGALMNARGLMELVILNIGLERGLITPTLFTIMVAMTLATTIAAGPLLDWAWRSSAEVPDAAGVPVR